MQKSQIKVLGVIYLATDCSNEVYDWATLHWTQEIIADQMPELVEKCDQCVKVDGDGCIAEPEKWGNGYRLTLKGYEALTEHSAEKYPANLRRFVPEQARIAREMESE